MGVKAGGGDLSPENILNVDAASMARSEQALATFDELAAKGAIGPIASLKIERMLNSSNHAKISGQALVAALRDTQNRLWESLRTTAGGLPPR